MLHQMQKTATLRPNSLLLGDRPLFNKVPGFSKVHKHICQLSVLQSPTFINLFSLNTIDRQNQKKNLKSRDVWLILFLTFEIIYSFKTRQTGEVMKNLRLGQVKSDDISFDPDVYPIDFVIQYVTGNVVVMGNNRTAS